MAKVEKPSNHDWKENEKINFKAVSKLTAEQVKKLNAEVQENSSYLSNDTAKKVNDQLTKLNATKPVEATKAWTLSEMLIEHLLTVSNMPIIKEIKKNVWYTWATVNLQKYIRDKLISQVIENGRNSHYLSKWDVVTIENWTVTWKKHGNRIIRDWSVEAEYDKSMAEISKKLSKLNTELQTLNSTIQAKKTEIDWKDSKLKTKQNELKDIKEQITKLETKIAQTNTSLQSNRQEKVQIETEIENIKEEIQKINVNILTLSSTTQEKTIRQTQEELGELNKALQEKRSEIQLYFEQNRPTSFLEEEEEENINIAIASKEQELEARKLLAAKQAELAEKESELTAKETEIKRLTEENKTDNSNLDWLKAQKEPLEIAIKTLSTEIDALTSQLAKLNTEKGTSDANIDITANKHNTLFMKKNLVRDGKYEKAPAKK